MKIIELNLVEMTWKGELIPSPYFVNVEYIVSFKREKQYNHHDEFLFEKTDINFLDGRRLSFTNTIPELLTLLK